MRELLMLLAVVAGCALPIQAAINGQLRTVSGSPLLTSFISFATGTLLLGVIHFAVLRGGWPGWPAMSKAPAWMWLGGPLGTLFVLTAILVAPRIGTASLMVLVVAGQMVAAIALDHYGAIGLAVREATPMRLLGGALTLLGAYLVTRF